MTWKHHLEGKIKKAKGMLYKFKQIVGLHWGPKPKYMRWLWMGVVRPMVLYGAIVWFRAAANTTILQKLNRLNRLATLTWSTNASCPKRP